MPQPTVEAALFKDLDDFLTGIEQIQDTLSSIRVSVDRKWQSTAEIDQAGIEDPFKARLQVVGGLTLTFLMPDQYDLKYSGKNLPVEAAIHRVDESGLYIPTGGIIDLVDDTFIRGKMVQAVLDEDRLSEETAREVRDGVREIKSPVSVDIISANIGGERLVAPITMLTETNRSSFYNLDIVPAK